MCSSLKWIHFMLLWIHTSKSMSLINQRSYFMDASAADNDVADIMLSKGYLASEKESPTVVKTADNDITYLLSKLSDEELIKLLNEDSKQEVYDFNDIVKVAVDGKSIPDDNKLILSFYGSKAGDAYEVNPSYNNKRFRTIHSRGQRINDKKLFHVQSDDRNKINAGNQEKTAGAYFRLEDKRVEPFNTKNHIEPNYTALQKINNLLYTRPQVDLEDSDEGDDRRELLFDVLVAQLKTLCCKRHKLPKARDIGKQSLKTLMADILTRNSYSDYDGSEFKMPKEFMFLIINDEIKGNGSGDLISVDPESLDKNSSVLLLGPILTPMSNLQLKGVMTRISNELSKPDYEPLLQQISEGTLTGNNIRLMNSLVTGPNTRRYIKPHRCNHQSPLAKVYGGPKWIICSGYLNLNTPSIYD